MLADIFLGKIKAWNDKAIADLNPGIKLDGPITASDGSGTTFVDYLRRCRRVEEQGRRRYRRRVAGRRGRQGQRGLWRSTCSAYQGAPSATLKEYAYAKERTKLDHIQLKNRDGGLCSRKGELRAASAGADWKGTPGMGVIRTDQPGAKSWPMTSASFV